MATVERTENLRVAAVPGTTTARGRPVGIGPINAVPTPARVFHLERRRCRVGAGDRFRLVAISVRAGGIAPPPPRCGADPPSGRARRRYYMRLCAIPATAALSRALFDPGLRRSRLSSRRKLELVILLVTPSALNDGRQGERERGEERESNTESASRESSVARRRLHHNVSHPLARRKSLRSASRSIAGRRSDWSLVSLRRTISCIAGAILLARSLSSPVESKWEPDWVVAWPPGQEWRKTMPRCRTMAVLQEKATTPDNTLSQTRVERQRSGGEDSAVPLSPVSIASLGDPSPALHQPPSPLLKASVDSSSHQPAIGRPAPMNGTMRGATTPVLSAVPADDNAELGEDALFSLDEDHDTVLTRPSAFLPADDEAETDDSGTGEDYYYTGNSVLQERMQQQHHQNQGAVPPPIKPIRGAAPGAGMLASKFGTSLPVTIPGRFWPPKDAKDSFVAEGDESSDDEFQPRQKTVLPTHRVSKDMFQDMRAQARSIQAADDPERLFGERPQRRRYRTGDVVRTGEVVRMRASVVNATVTNGGGSVIVPSSATVGCDRC
uniref:Uncharacterized protein n=1 Tax=Plectus sambesii TaxID=2011161 RepID=A0A914UJZ3_9BILA